MPETRSLDNNIYREFMYALYELFVPLFISLIICIPTNFIIK